MPSSLAPLIVLPTITLSLLPWTAIACWLAVFRTALFITRLAPPVSRKMPFTKAEAIVQESMTEFCTPLKWMP